MKQSKVIQTIGTEGQKFEVHAHVERSESPHVKAGPTLTVTTTYEDTRNPDEHRTVFKQGFQSEAEFDRFVGFLAEQRKS
jgi:hypothetical protein